MTRIPPPKQKPRARDLGLPVPGTPGPLNAITDVPGVLVGFTTLTDPAQRMRTGVTAIRPRPDRDRPEPVYAGFFSFNGNGEMTGTHWIADAGYMQGPILITNTHGIGACHHGATAWMMRHYGPYFREETAWAMPVVAETYDGGLNDITALHVRPEDAEAALDAAAAGPVPEGSVGGGNGMIAYEFKAGTGTASRRVTVGGQGYMLGVLVQANFGRRPWFTPLGVPVGAEMPVKAQPAQRDQGSIIVVIATDAPLSDTLLSQLARRASLGIGRSGTVGGNSSGDLFLAFSTATPTREGAVETRRTLDRDQIDPLYQAAVEAVDEAVLNAIVQGEDVPYVKPMGKICEGIDTARLVELMRTYGRM